MRPSGLTLQASGVGEQSRVHSALALVDDLRLATLIENSMIGLEDGHPCVIDEIVRLREWGTNTAYLLPPDLANASRLELRLGSAADVAAEGAALLVRCRGKWLLKELPTGGTTIDRGREHEVALEPGAEVRIGRRTFIAESIRSILLRGFMCRLIGWSPEQRRNVDEALRSIRTAILHRTPLILCGECDLVSIAGSIHRRVCGTGRPFVLCDPRIRSPGEENPRIAERYTIGAAAVDAAANGTVCLRLRRLPRDYQVILAALRDPCRYFNLMVSCTLQTPSWLAVNRIVIPPLMSRADELGRIIDEYVNDAAEDLSVDWTLFQPEDRQWVRDNDSVSLTRIQKATRYILALRASPNISVAATCLEIAPQSLSHWIRRRDSWPGLASMRRHFPGSYVQRFLGLWDASATEPAQPQYHRDSD
jgi:hypothetical protein